MLRDYSRWATRCRRAGFALLAFWLATLILAVSVPEEGIWVGDKVLRSSVWSVSLQPPPVPSGLRLFFYPPKPPRVWLRGTALPNVRLLWMPVFALGYGMLWCAVVLERASKRRGFLVMQSTPPAHPDIQADPASG